MALGDPRTHAPKAPVASRLLPASYLFPKPEPVRIGGSSWGILSLVAQHQTPHGNIESGVSLNKCDAQAASQSPDLLDIKMIRALENPKATRTARHRQAVCSYSCKAAMRYYGHLFFNLHGPIGKGERQRQLANMLYTCAECWRNH